MLDLCDDWANEKINPSVVAEVGGKKALDELQFYIIAVITTK